MTLVNPSNDQLDKAFAEHVAGWKFQKGTPPTYGGTHTRRGWKKPDGRLAQCLYFTSSADLVLSWLEKQKVVTSNWILPDSGNRAWRVDIYASIDDASANKGVGALDESFAKAAVIALLRAHSIEVEFE